MKKQASVKVGDDVQVVGRTARVTNIKGRWVRVEFEGGKSKNVGFADISLGSSVASKKPAKGDSGVIKKEYLDRYETHIMKDGTRVKDNGDAVAKKVRGTPLDEVYQMASEYTGRTLKDLRDKYGRLNPGMQAMTLRNMLRGQKNTTAKT